MMTSYSLHSMYNLNEIYKCEFNLDMVMVECEVLI